MKSVLTRFVGVPIFISNAIPKWCLRYMSRLKYFSAKMRRNWTGRSEGSSGSDIDIGGGDLVIRVDLFSLVREFVYYQSLT